MDDVEDAVNLIEVYLDENKFSDTEKAQIISQLIVRLFG